MPGAEMDDGPAVASDEPTPEQVSLDNELQQAIQECINALSEDQRMAIVLSDVQGMNYQEIADATAASLGTVKSRLRRGTSGSSALFAGLSGTFASGIPSYR